MAEASQVSGSPADPGSFELLLVPLLDPAYRLAWSITQNAADAEDVVQEAAMRAFRAFHTFETGTNFKAWFYRILTNCCFARHRSRKRAPELIDLENAGELYLFTQTREAGYHERSNDPAKLLMEKISEQRVAEAIAMIPEEYAQACALYFLEEHSYQEIAEILEIPVGTVRSRLHRGRRMLQKALWTLAEEEGIITNKEDRQVTP
jgi:RNA polymerase sigma-70 factor (ECF subfamily)